MAIDNYQFFNKFQIMFYTSITEFNKFTHFEIKNNSFLLLNNLMKGFPHTATEILDIYSPHIKAIESPSIIIALQRKFVNNFSRARVPQHVYYKSKTKAESKKKIKESNNGIIFDSSINNEIMSILFIDSKTFDYLKFTDKIQKLGKELTGENIKKEEEKISKARKRKNIEII